MYLRDVLHSCLRRWYLLLAALVLTAGGGYLTVGAVSPEYQASASVVLLPPDAVIAVGDNPYLYLGGLDQALGVLQVKMNSPEIAKPIEAPYVAGNGTFAVAKDVTTTGPIMRVTATGDDTKTVLQLLNVVIQSLPPNLLALQQELGVSKSSRITTMVLATDHEAEISHKRQLRALIVVCGGGVVGSVLLVGWLDRLILARWERRVREFAAGAPSRSRRPEEASPVRPSRQAAAAGEARRAESGEQTVGVTRVGG